MLSRNTDNSNSKSVYLFKFDESMNFKQVMLPSRNTYKKKLFKGIGFVRNRIDYNSEALVEIDKDDLGNILSIYYPGEGKNHINSMKNFLKNCCFFTNYNTCEKFLHDRLFL